MRRAFVSVGVFVILSGCTSSSSSTGAPVADPGGPFNTKVSSNLALGSLGAADTHALCQDLASAFDTFLGGAVQTANLCYESAFVSTQETLLRYPDAGIDSAAACSMGYSECRANSGFGNFTCPIPFPLDSPPCSATVEDLSACLNEIAALDPLGVCIYPASCDAGVAPDAALPPQNWPPSGAPMLSATPACARLQRICSALGSLVYFPCF
jgi:hypothetical protein